MFDPQNERKRKNFERTPQSRGSGKGGPRREGGKGKSVYIIVAVTHTFCPRFPNGNYAWVVISLGFRPGNFSGYTPNSFPRATFDLTVFDRRRSPKRMVCLFFPVDLAIQK